MLSWGINRRLTMTSRRFSTLDSRSVMSYLIRRCRTKQIDINATKLQKLMYCCYGAALAALGVRLCDESPEAWQYGPVFPRTLRMLKDYGVDGFEQSVPPATVDQIGEDVAAIMDEALDIFGKYSASQLSSWSHRQGSPWFEASRGGRDLYGQITDKLIYDYFDSHVIDHDEKAEAAR